MLKKLTGGRIYDPAHGVENEVRDIYILDGRIVKRPDGIRIDEEIDVRGKVVMAGAIDMHTHIGGGKVNIARTMLPEDHAADVIARTELMRSGCGHAAPSTLTAGYRYAEMGYTAGFEPAILPSNARQAHMEMHDTPIIDKGGYVMLGSDDFLLRMMAANKDQESINNYVAWTMTHSQAVGLKVVNPGGINAFKFNQRKLDLDEKNQFYGVTPREILLRLARAVNELGVPHPLHVHGCNLGVPGNMDTTLDTIQGIEGLPMHMTHIQFHSYGTEGDFKFSSGSAQIAEAINKHKNVTVDVGQILFGQTVTASGDSMRQFAAHPHSHPNKWVCMDIECEAGARFVADDAALAEDDVAVAVGEDVFGGEEPLLDGGPHAPLEEHGLGCSANFVQKSEVLHVAAAYLEDVREAGDDLHVAGVHHLGDDREAGLGACGRENLEPLFAVAAEGVGAGAGLEGAASEQVGAGRLHRPRRLYHVLFRVHRTGAGHGHQPAVADLHRPHLDDGIILLDLAAGELERLGDADDGVYAVEGAELIDQLRVDGAENGDDAALHSLD